MPARYRGVTSSLSASCSWAQGTGTCWAYWMRYVDRGLDEPATRTRQTEIREDDADLIAVQAYCKLKSR